MKGIVIFIGGFLIGVLIIWFMLSPNLDSNRQTILDSELESEGNYDSNIEGEFMYTGQDYFEGVNKLHWYRMPITYTFSKTYEEYARDCPDYQKSRVRDAFQEITNATGGVVYFKEEEIYGDIFILCYNAEGSGGYMTEGEAMPTMEGNIITQGDLFFYNHRNCGTWPDVEIHEILHLFGYKHVDDEWSIMDPIASRCDLGKIDEDIIKDLIGTYKTQGGEL